MKTSHFLLLTAVVAAAGAGGWWLGRARHDHARPAAEGSAATNGQRRVQFYQSPMHPWIKSDQPGNCTICGMALTPVYEGDAGFAAGEGVVTLGTNTIQAIHVATAVVAEAPLRRTLRFAGVIEDDDSRHRFLSAYVAGRIDRLFVNYQGAEVQAGQPLAWFFSPMLLAAQREYLALKEQSAGGGAAEGLLAAAAQRLRQYGLSDAQIAGLHTLPLTNIHTELLAPITGTVVKRTAYEGQYVMEGQELFELADFSTMWFQFDAYEQDLPWLAPGQEVAVTTPSRPGQTFTGRIAFIDPNVRELSRSARVRVELPNPTVNVNGREQRLLLHRLFAEATVTLANGPVLLVPRTAVLMPDHRPVVYVDQGGGAYEQRTIKLGRRGDTHWEVLDGLTAGEAVVTQGNLLIDAQAQLNSGAGPAHDHGEPGGAGAAPGGARTDALPAVDAGQRAVLDELFTAADRLATALAADDLAAFNQATPPWHELLPRAAAAFAGVAGWSDITTHLNREGHPPAAADLRTARAAFHRLVMPVAELALAVHQQDAAAPVKVFQCPMTARAFDGAPARARWVQLRPEIRNPYYGAAMLDCGTEIKGK